jgi:hypothetical protein
VQTTLDTAKEKGSNLPIFSHMGSRARLILVGLAFCVAAVPAHAAVVLATPSADLLGPIGDPLVDGVTDTLDSVLGTDPITSPVEALLESTIGVVDDTVDEVVNAATDPIPPTPVDPLLPTTTILSLPTTTLPALTTTTSIVITIPTVPVNEPRPGPLPEPLSATFPATISTVVASVSAEAALGPSQALLISPVDALAPTDEAQNGWWADILDFVGEINIGSFLAAPWLALEVLLRALASAGKGLLAPGMMLVALAMLMARDRRISGTKTP